MFAFYVVRGNNLDYLAGLSYFEKQFMHHARDKFYKEEAERYKSLFGEGGK
jgi:hypothetical protein